MTYSTEKKSISYNSLKTFFSFSSSDFSWDEEEDKLLLLWNDKIVFKIMLAPEEEDQIAFYLISDEFKLVSPYLENYSDNSYLFNYKNLALKDDNYFEFYFLIFKNNENKFLVLTIDFLNDFLIKKVDEKIYFVSFSFDNKFFFNVKFLSNINELYKNISESKAISLLPIGFIYTFKSENFFFSDLKVFFEHEDITVLIKEIDLSLIKNNKKLRNAFEALILKLKFNNFLYIFEFDNSVDIFDSNNLMLIKKRDGEVASYKNRTYINIFNEIGRQNLIEMYEKLFHFNPIGFLLKRVNAVFDNETLDKAICKQESIIIPYNKNVKEEIKILNQIINIIKNKYKNIMFFSPLFSKWFNTTKFYFRPKHLTEKDLIIFIQDLFWQGYYDFVILLEEDFCNPKDHMISILLSNSVFFDWGVIKKISNNAELFFIFKKLLKLRRSLKCYIENFLNEYVTDGNIPIKVDIEDNVLKGIFFGEALYISILQDRIFDPFYYIPIGNWLDIEENEILKGNCTYINRRQKLKYRLLLKENSVVLFYKNCLRNEVIFYIYLNDSIEKNIEERVIDNDKVISVSHKIDSSIGKNMINIVYKQTPLIDRLIYFVIIAPMVSEVKEIFILGKKVLFTKKENLIEFNCKIEKENTNIKIYI